jgi:hypothetical protein
MKDNVALNVSSSLAGTSGYGFSRRGLYLHETSWCGARVECRGPATETYD